MTLRTTASPSLRRSPGACEKAPRSRRSEALYLHYNTLHLREGAEFAQLLLVKGEVLGEEIEVVARLQCAALLGGKGCG